MRMIDLSTYRFTELGARLPRLYRAHAEGAASVLVAGRGDAAPSTLRLLQREYALRGSLHADWAAVPQALLPHGDGAALLFADPGGDTLRQRIGEPLALPAFLALAGAIAAAMQAMHAAGLLHRALTPATILVDDTGRVHLSGFGFAARLDTPAPADAELEWDPASFAYMAPELGARMNVPVDGRADLYALGCIFCELLTGTPPFDAADPAALVHAHATRPPPPLPAGLPEPVAQLVLKLLEKSPAQRHPDAAALLADLRRCEALQQRLGHIPRSALGAAAALQRLQQAGHVLGREAELEALVAPYRAIADGGPARTAWVSGVSGIGKSTLLREAVARMQRHGALLLTAGKSEEGHGGAPYALLAQALEPLLQFVLGGTESEFAEGRERIRHATAPVGRTLAAFLPTLALVLGPQPEAPEAPDAAPALERERVLQGMARLITCFANPARPLVLLLDDLQWADVGTLQVLERLRTHHADAPWLLLGAFRSNELAADHPLRSGPLAALPAVRLPVGPLDEAALRELLAQALAQPAHEVAPLAALIGRKTGHNPLFVRHLLPTLVDDGLLRYDEAAGAWRWTLAQIDAHRGIGDVLALMARKLEQLPEPARAALQRLACLGDRASTDTLAVAAGWTPADAALQLEAAQQAGCLHREGDDWVFRHDRIREAAYASLPVPARAPLHLGIARRLHARGGDVFAVAAQANLARAVVDEPNERLAFARLNLEAGRRAKAATAHHSALAFFRSALDFLGEGHRIEGADDRLHARLLCGEAEFMTGSLEAAEARLAALEQDAGDGIFGADLTRLRAALYTTLGRFDRALDVGLAFLRKAGIDVPRHPTEPEVDREHARLRDWLDRHGIAAMRELPSVVDPLRRALTDIFADLLPPALYTDQTLVDLMLLRMANLAIEHGHSDASANGYVCMMQIFGVRYGDYDSGHAFGELALHLVHARGLRKYAARVHMSFGTLVVPWAAPARSARAHVRRAFEIATESGDHTFALYCGRNEATGMLFAGEPLDDVRATVERALVLAREANFQLVVDALLAQATLLAALQDGPAGAGDAPREAMPEPAVDTIPTLVDFAYWVHRLQAGLLAGDLPEALAARERAQACASAARCFAESGDLPFYGALALLALPQRDARQQAAVLQHAAQLDAWVQACPDNFSARRELVRAEQARVQGQALEAADAYAAAVAHARRHGFTQVEALAAELAAGFHAARRQEVSARAYLRHAHGAWLRWGAGAQARRLQASHPEQLEADAASPAASRLQALDVQAVLRISHALASDIVPARLVETLMRTVLESAGAEHGALVLRRDGAWHVPAQASVAGGAIVVTQVQAEFAPQVLPVSLVQAVARTQQSVVLDDARDSAAWGRDEYLRRTQARSVLCVPLMRYAALVGVLVVENRLAPGVFTPAKAAVLESIASQAAFALENARLYDALVEQNRQRAQAEERLRGALAELASASRLKAMGELVASIVHEVGQPISAVDTSASAGLRWLNRAVPDIDEARAMLTHISRSATRAKAIIQGLRAMARKAEPQFAALDLGDALREAAELVAGPLAELDVRLVLHGLDAPCPVRGDRIQLQQVAVNLLMNGAEAMAGSEAGGSMRPLSLACTAGADGLVRVAIEDGGTGIAPELADRLLEPFFTTKANGMGMGLAICKSIVDAHSGALTLAARPAGGTCATFTLPRLTP